MTVAAVKRLGRGSSDYGGREGGVKRFGRGGKGWTMYGGKTADIEHIVVAVKKKMSWGLLSKKIRKTTFTSLKQLVLKICGSVL